MNRILIITSIVTAIAVLIYTVFAGLQWWAIRKQGAYASQQVEKMQGQLDAMKSQGLLMDQSLLESQKLALQTEKMATFAQHQLEVMKLQGDAMTTQCEIMTHSLLATKQLVEQNERAVKAAEETAKASREAREVEEAPYIAVMDIDANNVANGYSPSFKITFLNGGRTPAFGFHIDGLVYIADGPLAATKYTIQPEHEHVGNSFIAADATKTILFETNFRLSAEDYKSITAKNNPQHLFVEGAIHYQNIRGRKMGRPFRCVYYPSTGTFGYYDAG